MRRGGVLNWLTSRPAVWLAGGLFLISVAVMFGSLAFEAAVKLRGIEGRPSCATDFAEECTTTRIAVVVTDGYHFSGRRINSWLTGVKRWDVRLDARDAHGERNGHVDLPNQADRHSLVRGASLTVTYLAREPVWVSLSDGTVLTLEDHPQRAAPMWAAASLFVGGIGIMLSKTAVATGRRRSSWFRRTDLFLEPGVGLVVLVVGMVGVAWLLLTPRPAPLGVILAGLAAMGAVGTVRTYRRRMKRNGLRSVFRPHVPRHRRRAP